MKNNQKTGTARDLPLKKRRQAITRLPDWILRAKGWFYARKGAHACDAEIDRLRQRCFAVEHTMCAELEESILQLHVDSSLLQLNATHKEDKPAPPVGEPDAIQIRAAEAANARYEAARNCVANAKDGVVRINETLISAEHTFYQNIESLRAFAMAKIHAFVTGIRSNKRVKLSDYRLNDLLLFDGTAYSDYKNVHEADDKARNDFLEKLREVQ